MGHRSLRGQNKFELYKRGLEMASSIKSQPNSDDLEDFVLTKAEKVHTTWFCWQRQDTPQVRIA